MNLWQRKLLAYLHDPPHKPFNVAGHEDARKSALIHLGLTIEEMWRWEKKPDWHAAAADRVVFPDPSKSGLRVDWRDDQLAFIHPLAGTALTPTWLPRTADVAEDWINGPLNGIIPPGEQEPSKANFLRVWRFWRERACENTKRHALAYLVADTRIPDHTLWQHSALTGAFEGCTAEDGQMKCAFLLFQIGPVQEFIAQARKTQDLWSGSYLLSFLIAQGMLAIADKIGPDAIIYPQLRGAPLADWHWKQAGIFQQLVDGEGSLHPNELLTPGLPNRFLALLPAPGADELAAKAKERIEATWKNIASKVHDFLAQHVGNDFPNWDCLWDEQVKHFPQIDYVVHRWQDTQSALEAADKGEPPLHGDWKNHPLNHAVAWATQMIPANEREPYAAHVDNLNPSSAWALHYAVTDWLFAAKKNMRAFEPWKGCTRPKDALDGKAEVLGPDHQVEDFWRHLRSHTTLSGDFKSQQSYGALTVIKRLWPKAYLSGQLGWQRFKPSFESVTDIARAIDREEGEAQQSAEPQYYAVLSFDGDEMGKWVSGMKSPLLKTQLAPEAERYFRDHWDAMQANGTTYEQVRRVLTPSYHAALSEALSNFSLYCVRPIIAAFGGQLIYCGGDDVMAMLPSANAIACAEALYWTFRGQQPATGNAAEVLISPCVRKMSTLFEFLPSPEGGFVRLLDAKKGQPRWPLTVLGPRATASVGIAIGHVRSPMQDTIQAARDAEKRAKEHYNRDAFCVRISKRSGESLELGGQWRLDGRERHPQLRLVESLLLLLVNPDSGLSGRLPYRLGQVLRPLGFDAPWSEVRAIVAAETKRVLSRQGEGLTDAQKLQLAGLVQRFAETLPDAVKLRDYLAPFLTAAWLARHHPASRDEVREEVTENETVPA